jgi:hypothetical protein
MSLLNVDYQNKYLKYKKNTSILPILINNFANLDYATKYVIFDGDINDLYNLHGGTFFTTAQLKTFKTRLASAAIATAIPGSKTVIVISYTISIIVKLISHILLSMQVLVESAWLIC